jgi:hypothetical protein
MMTTIWYDDVSWNNLIGPIEDYKHRRFDIRDRSVLADVTDVNLQVA